MSKEMEALKRMETSFTWNKEGKTSVYKNSTNSSIPYYEDFHLVENALKALEIIDKKMYIDYDENCMNLTFEDLKILREVFKDE